jgi:ribosome-associated toxin RatA of RatAB toxin-antitoxin module
MHKIEKSVLTAYTAAQMYALVNQVEDYAQFLPGCTETQVQSRTQRMVVAMMCFQFKGISQSLTTRNTLESDRSIRLALVKGPFKNFEGIWQFNGISEENGKETACRVSLVLNFTLSNKLLDRFLSPFLEQAVDKVMQVFIDRAAQVYG